MNTGLPVFDTTVQETNEWLKEVANRLKPCDRQQAYAGLRAVLHALRDRLPFEGVLSLSAQLPMLLRGVYLEGWRPIEGQTDIRDPQVFFANVQGRLPPAYPREPNGVAEAVFGVMDHRLDPGEVQKLLNYLPTPLRQIWPAHHPA